MVPCVESSVNCRTQAYGHGPALSIQALAADRSPELEFGGRSELGCGHCGAGMQGSRG